MEPALRAAVEAVHASPLRAVLHVTGGGAQSVGWIAAVPGASRTPIDARVPYARESMADALASGPPAQFVSASTARDMAVAAYRRGARLCGGDRHLVGLGCTCALTSHPPKRGEHRCHVATFGARGFAEYVLTMEKGRRDRWEEDGLASALVVQALADAAAEAEADGDFDAHGTETHHQRINASSIMAGRVVPPGDVFERTRTPLGDPLEYLIRGDGDVVEFSPVASCGPLVCQLWASRPAGQLCRSTRIVQPAARRAPTMLERATARPARLRPGVRARGDERGQGDAADGGGRRRVAQFAGEGRWATAIRKGRAQMPRHPPILVRADARAAVQPEGGAHAAPPSSWGTTACDC